MNLYVMRHGPAEDESNSGRDEDRALTPRGRERVRDVAKALVSQNEVPAVIVSSPLVRTTQTAEIVAAVIGLTEKGGSVTAHRELEPGGDAFDLVYELAKRGHDSAMVVGHEPDLSSLVRRLVGRSVPVTMDKATVAGLAIESDGTREGKGESRSGKVRLRFVLEPKSLTWEHDAREGGK